jgi:molybdate transport system substrate-binding protein
MTFSKAVSVLVIGTLGLTACTTGTNNSSQTSVPVVETEVIVFAAASLTQTFTEIANKFEAANPGVQITISFAGSATLAEQINQGAPVDVFASASIEAMARTVTEIPKSSVFAKNRVVIAYPIANPKNILNPQDLANPDLIWIQCDHQVPCGAATDKALSRAGITAQPKSLEPDVNSVLIKLLNGEVDAAIVYLTDVIANSGLKSVEFGNNESAATSYSIGQTTTASAAAKDFIDFVLAQPGQEVLISAGFDGKTNN